MRWSPKLLLLLAPLGALAGCRSPCDKVEAELRAREEDVRHLKEELHGAEFRNRLLTGELAAYQGLPGPEGVVRAPTAPYPVRTIRLGRNTGPKADDEQPWSQALTVHLEPIDTEGKELKAPGALKVEVYEVSESGVKSGLSAWVVPPDELRTKWQTGLFSTGYILDLPWKVWPSTEKLRVRACFQMPDGRVFEADKDVTVRVAPERLRKTLPAAPAGDLPPPTPVVPPTPTPTPMPMPPVVPPPTKPEEKPKDTDPGKIPPPAPPPTGDKLPPPTPEKKPASEEGPELPTGAVRARLLKPVPLPPED